MGRFVIEFMVACLLSGCNQIFGIPGVTQGDVAPSIDASALPPDTAAPDFLALDCNTYCTHLAADCSGANAQISMANCMGICMTFPPGAATDTSGNTLGCRNHLLHTIERQSSPEILCPYAGPVGGPIANVTAACGTSPCDDFCALLSKVCGTDANPVTVGGSTITNRYASPAACLTACTNFAKIPEASPAVTTGNNFACRIYHLTNAAAQTAATIVNLHCGHTLDSWSFPQSTVAPCFY